MINWLVFFPPQTKVEKWLRYILSATFATLSLISGCILLIIKPDCKYKHLGTFQIINAITIVFFFIADIYVYSIKHYAELWRQIIGCFIFIVALLMLLVSIVLPTMVINVYKACPAYPRWTIVVEYGVLSFSYIYILIHIVLFVYHCHLRTQLTNMNIEDMRNHMIDPNILPKIYNIDFLLQSHSEIQVKEWIPQYKEFVKNQRRERKLQKKKNTNIMNIMNTMNIMNMNAIMNEEEEENADVEVNLTCPICFCDLNEDDYVYNIACKHLFHMDCLERWYTRRETCPLCKQRINFIVTTENNYTFNRELYTEQRQRDDSISIEMVSLTFYVSLNYTTINSINGQLYFTITFLNFYIN